MPACVTSVPHIIGCDVGKASIALFDAQTGKVFQVANRPKDLADLVASLSAEHLVICEATGGYETNLLLACLEAGVPVHRADARKVKAFIRSLGRLAKTDAIDAQGLARYAQERHAYLTRWQPPAPALEDLATLVKLRIQLVEQRKALTNQLKAPGGRIAKRRLEQLRAAVAKQIDAVETDLASLLDQEPEIRQRVETMTTIPGCGTITALTLTALMPELGRLSGKAAASLAGLAPHPNQSGARNAYRRVRGGRPAIKRALFMAAMAARRHNTHLKPVYNRLVQAGKKPLVAITALMRKLIVIINAKLRDLISLNSPQLS